jgi:hypothetical protein
MVAKLCNERDTCCACFDACNTLLAWLMTCLTSSFLFPHNFVFRLHYKIRCHSKIHLLFLSAFLPKLLKHIFVAIHMFCHSLKFCEKLIFPPTSHTICTYYENICQLYSIYVSKIKQFSWQSNPLLDNLWWFAKRSLPSFQIKCSTRGISRFYNLLWWPFTLQESLSSAVNSST